MMKIVTALSMATLASASNATTTTMEPTTTTASATAAATTTTAAAASGSTTTAAASGATTTTAASAAEVKGDFTVKGLNLTTSVTSLACDAAVTDSTLSAWFKATIAEYSTDVAHTDVAVTMKAACTRRLSEANARELVSSSPNAIKVDYTVTSATQADATSLKNTINNGGTTTLSAKLIAAKTAGSVTWAVGALASAMAPSDADLAASNLVASAAGDGTTASSSSSSSGAVTAAVSGVVMAAVALLF